MNHVVERAGYRVPHLRQAGLTLVELMIAMTIGLIFTLAVSLSVLTTGRQFQVVGSTSTAQVNAQVALAQIDEAGRSAGAGLYANGQLLCPTINAWRDGTMISNGGALMPVRIADGGGAQASDSVVFTASKATGPLSGMPVMVDTTAGLPNVVVSNAGLLAVNDLAIVGVPGSTVAPCTLFQLTGPATVGAVCGGNATECKTLPRATNAATGFNPLPGTFGNEPLYGFVNNPGTGVVGPAAVHRLGTDFRQDAFAVQCDTLVQYNAFTTPVLPACTSNPLSFGAGVNALATDVVLMHAQYGISASAASDVVTNWVDATGAWTAPSVANIARIKAIRVVVVARAKEPEPQIVVVNEQCTNAGGVANYGPCSFDDAEAPAIDLRNVSVPGGRTWRHYRYRVYQAVIPLRNVIWST